MRRKKKMLILENEYIQIFLEKKAIDKESAKTLEELELFDDKLIEYMLKGKTITKVGDRYYADKEYYTNLLKKRVFRSLMTPVVIIILSILYYIIKN